MPRYSDDQLTRAIATSTSWRGVLRALGLQATSAGASRSARGRADRLGLSYAHFRGQRQWCESQLAAAVAVSSSWSQVASTVGLAGGSATTTLRGHALRLGLDTAHLSGQPAREQRDEELAPQRTHLARAGSLMAAAWFELCGLPVSWPLEPSRYDLLVWRRRGAERIQVKTTTLRAGSTWTVGLSTSRKEVHTYGPEEIDQFFIIDGDLKQYLIPLKIVGGLKAINLSAYQGFLLPGI